MTCKNFTTHFTIFTAHVSNNQEEREYIFNKSILHVTRMLPCKQSKEDFPFYKREYLLNILIMCEWHLHFHSVVPDRLQDGSCTLPDCTIASEDLHYCIRTCIFTSRTCIIASGPALFYRNLSVQKNKTNGRK